MPHIPDTHEVVQIEDIRRVVRKLKERVGRFPGLARLLERVPAEYDEDAEIELASKRGKIESGKEAVFDEVQRAFVFAMDPEIDLLKTGNITIEAFERRLMEEVKDLTVMAAMAGFDGAWSDVTPAQWGQIGAHVRAQNQYIRGFIREIRTRGIDNWSTSQLRLRVKLYANGARPAFERATVWDKTKGELNPSWLPGMPAIGTKCRMNCRCYWAIRKVKTMRGHYWVVSWKLRDARHCSTCPERERQWKGLKVYPGGRIEPTPNPINYPEF